MIKNTHSRANQEMPSDVPAQVSNQMREKSPLLLVSTSQVISKAQVMAQLTPTRPSMALNWPPRQLRYTADDTKVISVAIWMINKAYTWGRGNTAAPSKRHK